MLKYFTFLNKVIIFTLLSVSVKAADIDIMEMSLKELLDVEVVTTSKYKENISDAAGNIYVFTQQQIKDRGYRSVWDILKAMPSVDVHDYSILGVLNTVNFRGSIGNDKFLILQDGVRLNSPTGENDSIGHNFPIYYAKQIEVLLGPASVVYGADAFMGVINIITHDREDKDRNEIQISAGEDSYAFGHIYSHQTLSDSVQLSLGLQGYRSQDFNFAEDFPELYNDSSKQYEFAPTREQQFFSKLDIGEHWKMGLNYSQNKNAVDFTAKPFFSSFDKSAQYQVNQSTVFVQFQTELSQQLKSTSLLTYKEYTLDNKTYFNNLFSGFQPGYKYADTKSYTFNQDFEFNLNNDHYLSGGLVYQSYDTIPQGPDLPTPYNESQSPDNQNLFYANTTLPIAFFDDQYNNVGIYIQDNWIMDEFWRLIAGIRYDDNSLYGDSTNPRISLIYTPNENQSLKIMLAKSFLAPSSNTVFNSFGSFTGAQNGNGEWISTAAPFRVPNTELEPETAGTFEIVYTQWLSASTQLKLSPFYIKIDNVISNINDVVADQAIPGADLQRTSRNANIGESKAYGIDIGIEDKQDISGISVESWVYYSYIDGELSNQSTTTSLPLTTKHKLKGGATFHFSNGILFTPAVNWLSTIFSRQPDTGNADGLKRLPGYIVFDLHAEWPLNPQFSLNIDIYNLTDEKYYNGVFPPEFVAFDRAPQPGRLIAAGLKFEF